MVTVIVSMTLAFILGAYTGVKALQMGLKYQIQMSEGKTPELKPVSDAIERHQEVKAQNEVIQQATKINNVTSEMIQDLFGGE